MNKIPIYYEKCNNLTMPYYSFFLDKLKQIQQLSKYNNPIYLYNANCTKCANTKLYKLGNIVWSNNIKHKISHHKTYPSEYFIQIIINTCIINDTIINPPIQLYPNQIAKFTYIPLHYNKLLILDALMKQGSEPRYQLENRSGKEKYIYSEHFGVLLLDNKIIDSVITSTESSRIDASDNTIYLPTNTKILAQHEFLFHTHPNTITYAGRINEGIIYEFPSANDLLNFVKFHNEGKAQASIIIAPEGIYVIRPLYYQNKIQTDMKIFYHLRKFILKIERIAINKLKPIPSTITTADIFHTKVGSNLRYIRMYNKFIEQFNLFIEYYPREKKNNEWALKQINLQYLAR